MSVKRDQQDLIIKEAYRKWQVLKIEVREARGLLNLAVGVMQLELEQVQARMMGDLERLDDEIVSICAEIKVAYGKASEKLSLNDADGVQVWRQVGRELEEQLKLRKIERRKLILQMGALADESLRCGEYWGSYTELAKETEELRSNLEHLRHEAEEARSNYRQIVFQEKLAV